jgi:hypothetical protein
VITGRSRTERGRLVTVLAQWMGQGHPAAGPGRRDGVVWYPGRGGAAYRQAPRNVLIERADGTRAVRPFRGLRKIRGGGGTFWPSGTGTAGRATLYATRCNLPGALSSRL